MSRRLLPQAIASGIGAICAVSGFGWVTFLICVFLLSTAVFRGSKGLILWPVGLMVSMLIIYVSYVAAWLVGRNHITHAWSIGAMLILQIIASASAFVRADTAISGDDAKRNNPVVTAIQVVLFSVVPLAICFFATRQLLFDQVNLVAGHVPGGDHGSHVGRVFDITEWGPGAIKSPLILQGPRSGIPNLVAHVALSSSSFTSNHFFQAFLFSSWFDRIQFAALLQLSAFVAVRYWKEVNWQSIIAGNVVIVTLLSIDGFVKYLLWAGNTTSLGASWIALTLFVPHTKTMRKFARWSIVVGAAMLLVYQILLIPYLVILLVALTPQKLRVWVSVLLPVVIVAVMYGPKGVGGYVFGTLLTPSMLMPPNFELLAIVTILILISSCFLLFAKEYSQIFAMDKWYLIPSAVSTALIGALLYRLNESTFPYYALKLLWHWLLIALPIMAGYLIFQLMHGLRNSLPTRQMVLAGSMAAVMLLVSVSGDRDPTHGLRHENGKWFADGLNQIDANESSRRIIAYSFFEAHYGANRAVENISLTPLPYTLKMFGGIDEICEFVRKEQVEEIITTRVDKKFLIRAGCPVNGIVYIEGQLE